MKLRRLYDREVLQSKRLIRHGEATGSEVNLQDVRLYEMLKRKVMRGEAGSPRQHGCPHDLYCSLQG